MVVPILWWMYKNPPRFAPQRAREIKLNALFYPEKSFVQQMLLLKSQLYVVYGAAFGFIED